MRAAVIWIVRGYKRWFSPMLPPACRYVPSCSEYAEQALEAHGVLKGGALAVWRLLRCHPVAKGGLDPVPSVRASDFAPATALRAGPPPKSVAR